MRKELVPIDERQYSMFDSMWPSFKRDIKVQAWENAGECCEMCGRRNYPAGTHHRVPENMLKHRGIVGRDNLANAANLCNGEGGTPDCHQIGDEMAAKGLFWNGEKFVPLSEINPECYRTFDVKPRKNKQRRHHR